MHTEPPPPSPDTRHSPACNNRRNRARIPRQLSMASLKFPRRMSFRCGEDLPKARSGNGLFDSFVTGPYRLARSPDTPRLRSVGSSSNGVRWTKSLQLGAPPWRCRRNRDGRLLMRPQDAENARFSNRPHRVLGAPRHLARRVVPKGLSRDAWQRSSAQPASRLTTARAAS